MSFDNFRTVVVESLPELIKDQDNHKHSAVIHILVDDHGFRADQHGWTFITHMGTLNQARDASPLANTQAFVEYLKKL